MKYMSSLSEYIKNTFNLIKSFFRDKSDIHNETTVTSEETLLIPKLLEICEKHEKDAQERYDSGRYKMNGYNYAKDMIAGVQNAAQLLVDNPFDDIDQVLKKLRDLKENYDSKFNDRESFGESALNGIIQDVEDLAEKLDKST